MPLVHAGRLPELPPGALAEVFVDGEPYALCNVEGEIYAISGRCPHRNGPLAQGALDGITVTCPWHAWSFDCRTGRNDFDSGCRVATYAVTIQGDAILLELPDA